MLYTKIQLEVFLGSGEEDIKVFFTIYRHSSYISLFFWAEPFKQVINTLSTEGPM